MALTVETTISRYKTHEMPFCQWLVGWLFKVVGKMFLSRSFMGFSICFEI